MDITLNVAILLIQIVGFGLAGVVIYRMTQEVGALNGTVTAQAEALKTVGELNKVALEMARLIEKNAEATVEDARRSLQRGRPAGGHQAALPGHGGARARLERLDAPTARARRL